MKNKTDSDSGSLNSRIFAGAIEKNIATIHNLRQEADDSRRWDQKWVDRIAGFVGSPNSLYAHFVFYGVYYIMYRSYDNLSSTASLEAMFLAIFVLVNQRRMNSVERRNSDLHLQTTLLIEQEITQLARVVDRLATRAGLEPHEVKDLDEVKKDVLPSEVLERIADHEKSRPTDSTSDHIERKS